MLRKIRSTLEKNGVDIHSTPILVALSGGADSVSLLLALKELGAKHLAAAHVNHCIRGDEADRDQDFCRELCEKNGIEFLSARINVPDRAKKNKISLETAARDERYAYLLKTAREKGYTLLTAHNANDNLETVLFNLGRGTSAKGLKGIPVSRLDKENVRIVRPLLYVTREEIENYLAEKDQSYCIDSTNLKDDATRNRLRHFVVPQFLDAFPEGLSAVSRMTALLSADIAYLEKQAEGLIERYNEKGIDAFKGEDIAIVSRAVKSICESLCKRNLSEAHISAVCDMIESRKGECALPNGIVILSDNKLSLLSETDSDCVQVSEIEYKQGIYMLWDGYVAEVTEEYTQIYSDVHKTITYRVKNCDILHKEKAVFRTRRAGDKVYLPKRRVTKTLKKLLNEKKINYNYRDRLPLLAVDDQVVLMPIDEFESGGK